ncbi:hypothetical protein IEO21_09592 [Rhodonia placenta]|uniref:Uncharacterized protein n=1 Tax=Rhodonia placenta TaxID=104341 RepID=A0A8H7TY99_9APHY|nr:hypothetical protein IEO21_09592 [Postia placenta]
MLGPSDGLVSLVVLLDRSGCAMGAQLLFAGKDKGRRTISEVDVNEVLEVKGMNKALTHSHNGERKQEPKPRIREDKYRPLKCRGAHHPTYRK